MQPHDGVSRILIKNFSSFRSRFNALCIGTCFVSNPFIVPNSNDCRFEKRRKRGKTRRFLKNRNNPRHFYRIETEKCSRRFSITASPVRCPSTLQLSVSRPIQRFSNVPGDRSVERDMKVAALSRNLVSFPRFVIIESGDDLPSPRGGN